jgi:hypothetical protein
MTGEPKLFPNIPITKYLVENNMQNTELVEIVFCFCFKYLCVCAGNRISFSDRNYDPVSFTLCVYLKAIWVCLKFHAKNRAFQAINFTFRVLDLFMKFYLHFCTSLVQTCRRRLCCLIARGYQWIHDFFNYSSQSSPTIFGALLDYADFVLMRMRMRMGDVKFSTQFKSRDNISTFTHLLQKT